jgi:hypothetical protein
MNVKPAGLFRGNRRRAAGLGALLAAGAMISIAPGIARADDTPTSMELLQACGTSTDYCEFHVSGAARDYWGAGELAGQTANCTGADQASSITWEKSTFSTNSFGTSLKVIAGASKAYMVGFKIAYQHEWTDTVTDRDTTKMTIPAGYMGRVTTSHEMEEVSGQYEMHFGSRFYGHYYWYLPMTVDSPKDGSQAANTTQSLPMTDEEKATYCG